jgi:hypothetical protein
MAANRMDNLTLASASHLASQGHITPEHHARIKHAVHKSARGPRVAPPAAPAFGSLAGAGHMMSTPTPVGQDENGGGL